MIAEYIENVRMRLRDAIVSGSKNEVNRLEELMRMLMIDGDKTAEKMPWDQGLPMLRHDSSGRPRLHLCGCGTTKDVK